MTDSDGEFLLIEAADALPDWLEPDTADHRVRTSYIPTPEGNENSMENRGNLKIWKKHRHCQTFN